jgi:cob(I)alamin adenosyltransferase
MKIYTKTGDGGTSGLYNGERRNKEDLVFEALGSTDELAAAVGVAREYCLEAKETDMAHWLEEILSRLLDVGSAVATPRDSTVSESKLNRTSFGEDAVVKLEALIDEMDRTLPPLKNFILPGGGLAAAHLHVARTAARNAERRVWPLVRAGSVDVLVGKYLNRLSDFLFTCARSAALRGRHAEVLYCKARDKREE